MATSGVCYGASRWSDRRGVVITFADPVVWGSDPGDAGYLHGLVIDRRRAGTGLGRAVLAGAEAHIWARDRCRARLDCVAANRRLQAYYQAAGHRQVGERSFDPGSGWHPTVLMDKTLQSAR